MTGTTAATARDGLLPQGPAQDAVLSAVGQEMQDKGFVVANGTKFYLDGSPYWCAGTNTYYAGLKWIMSNEEVPVLMQASPPPPPMSCNSLS